MRGCVLAAKIAVVLLLAALQCTVGLCARSAKFPNPLTDHDAADPCLLADGDKLYLYSTGVGVRGGGAFPIYVSDRDTRTSWTHLGGVFTTTTLPQWAPPSVHFWAPEVHKVNGRYVCYYCTWDMNERFCIGAATANAPDGPFTDSGAPIVSAKTYGLIDATYFQDPKTKQKWLLWKEDKNALNPQQHTDIILQELTTDGLKIDGKPHVVLTNDQPWEHELVEAPTLIFRDGYYYLFFSANAFTDKRYGIGVARSRIVTGPYVKYKNNPIVKSDARFDGPGHQFLFEETSGTWTMFYHARDNSRRSRRRLLMSDPVTWTAGGWPSVHDGTPSEGWSPARTAPGPGTLHE